MLLFFIHKTAAVLLSYILKFFIVVLINRTVQIAFLIETQGVMIIFNFQKFRNFSTQQNCVCFQYQKALKFQKNLACHNWIICGDGRTEFLLLYLSENGEAYLNRKDKTREP